MSNLLPPIIYLILWRGFVYIRNHDPAHQYHPFYESVTFLTLITR